MDAIKVQKAQGSWFPLHCLGFRGYEQPKPPFNKWKKSQKKIRRERRQGGGKR